MMYVWIAIGSAIGGVTRYARSGLFARLSQDLPVVIEIVGSPETIQAFLPILDGMMVSGLVTLEKVQVLQYGARQDTNA
jgi:PII-like signaling protein